MSRFADDAWSAPADEPDASDVDGPGCDAPRDTVEIPAVLAPPEVDSRGGFPIERTPAACDLGRCDGSGLLRAPVASLYSTAGMDDRCPCGAAS